jgi:UDP-N-acetylmuramate dehydrogenase
MLQIKNLKKNIVIAPYTTYKIGGMADYFLVAKNKEELVEAIIEARKNTVPYFVLGTGANILVGDKGFRGLVIKNEGNKISVDGLSLISESGATIEQIIHIATENNLSGFEHFAGIPSTVGGALWQNLHFLSPDRTKTVFIEHIFQSAQILDESNNLMSVDKGFFKFGYDHSILHERKLIVTEAVFNLEKKDKSLIKKQIEENLKWRMEKQPPLDKFPSCGSVFKKIEGVGAGRLIEKVGLKGYRIGGAQISDKHANFIINTGNAKACDVLSLIKLVQDTVKSKGGYSLETEIGLVGEL